MHTDKKETDRRIRRTKKLFRQAFIKLLEEKDYQQITVTDIVHYADYNRTTFYLHYKYKEELAEDVVQDVLDDLMHAFRSPFNNITRVTASNPSAVDRSFFQYIHENNDFLILWKKADVIPFFREKFMQTMKTLVKEAFLPSHQIDENMDLDLFVTFQAYGIAGLIKEWIESDFAASSEYMATQLNHILDMASLEIMAAVH